MSFPVGASIGDNHTAGNTKYVFNGIAWDISGNSNVEVFAGIQGDGSKSFKVKDAVNANEAVSKHQLDLLEDEVNDITITIGGY